MQHFVQPTAIKEKKLLEQVQDAIRANIDKRVTSHTLRHSFATHLLQRGGLAAACAPVA